MSYDTNLMPLFDRLKGENSRVFFFKDSSQWHGHPKKRSTSQLTMNIVNYELAK